MLVEKRRSGRTTRLADQAIQEIFKNGQVIVQDHHRTSVSSSALVNIITLRLALEHRIQSHQIVKKQLGYGRWGIGFTDSIENPNNHSLKYRIKKSLSLLVYKILYLVSKITK